MLITNRCFGCTTAVWFETRTNGRLNKTLEIINFRFRPVSLVTRRNVLFRELPSNHQAVCSVLCSTVVLSSSRFWVSQLRIVKKKSCLPGIVLSSKQPINPPTNIGVPSIIINIWSTCEFPICTEKQTDINERFYIQCTIGLIGQNNYYSFS